MDATEDAMMHRTGETGPALESGLLWAFRFDASGRGQKVEPARLASPVDPDDGWLWVHAALADRRCRDWLARQACLPEWAREVLTGPDEHLSLDHEKGCLVGIVSDVETDLAGEPERIGRLRFAATDGVLITARRHALRSVERVRQRVEAGETFTAPADVASAIVESFCDHAAIVARTLGDELDRIEDRVIAEGVGDERKRLGAARRIIIELHRQLAQMRQMFHRAAAAAPGMPADMKNRLGDVADRLDQVDQDMIGLQDRARLLQDEIGAKLTEATNRQVFTLSVLTATLMPPTLVTGFFGMNTGGLPFAASPAGTFGAFLIAIVAAGLAFWLLRRITREP
jgi:zinc transporter